MEISGASQFPRFGAGRFARALLAGATACAILGGAYTGVSLAQTTPEPVATVPPDSGAGEESGGDNDVTPEEVVSSAFSDTAEGRQALSEYLMGDNPTPRLLAARAVLAIDSVRRQREGRDPAEILNAADRIVQIAAEELCRPRVMRAQIPADFKPPPYVQAYDFGPRDSDVMSGFEPVYPDDPRVNRVDGGGVRAPDSNPLFSDGIKGLRGFSVPVENGPRRIILLTDDIGEADTFASPFGTTIRVDGAEYDVGDHSPAEWVGQAVLGGDDASQAAAPGSSGGASRGGATRGGASRGGALMIETVVENGKISLEFDEPNDSRKTFITGMLIEPMDRPSVLVRDAIAREAVLTSDQCLELEAELATAVAELVEDIETASGPENQDEFNNDLFDDGQVASPA